MEIKILYYVDTDDNTKGSIMAFPKHKDLHDLKTIEKIGKVLYDAKFGDKRGVSNSVAYEVVNKGIADLSCEMGNYAFGWEITELYS